MFRRFSKKRGARRRLPRACALRLDELEPRLVLSTLRVGAAETYHTINGALTAAKAGDTILVDPGTYQEQVIITKNNITLEGVSQAAMIESPATLAPNTYCIVEVAGAQNVTIANLTVEGPYSGGFTQVGSELLGLHAGIFVADGGSATIENNHVTKIEDNPLNNTTDDGFAILVGSSATTLNTTGSALVIGNKVDNYQKAGIDVANTGSAASIIHNTTTGLGPTIGKQVASQYGIVVESGAVGLITGNTVTANLGSSTPGIYLTDPGVALVEGNTVANNDYGIYVYQGKDDVISGNQVAGSTYDGLTLFDCNHIAAGLNHVTTSGGNGIVVDGGSTSDLVLGNHSTNNGFAGIYVDATSTDNILIGNSMSGDADFDAFDASTGNLTAGTGNLWFGNTGKTDNHGGGLV